jgi:putative FmdB family regulatory protein
MPLYDARCSDHGVHEVFQTLADFDKGLQCPECDKPMLRIVSPVAQAGPSDDRPLQIKQIGKTFTTKTQLKEYLKQNPDCEMVSSSSNSWKNFKSTARESADEYYRVKGYRDKEDYRKNIRKDMAEQKREAASKKS